MKLSEPSPSGHAIFETGNATLEEVGVERLKELLAGGPYARLGAPGLESVQP